MASERQTLAYRPDAEERALLEAIAKRYGMSLSRAVGYAIRQTAAREELRAEPVAVEAGK
jgi:hypothetical protein